MELPDSSSVSRRTFARAAVAVGGAAALAACLESDASNEPDDAESDPEHAGSEGTATELDAPAGVDDPSSLPARQHAWNDALSTDADGNVVRPEHHVLLELSLETDVDDEVRDRLESALRGVERAVERSADGILFTVGYAPAYFDRFDEALPASVDLPDPEPLPGVETTDDVTVGNADALLHLAGDDAAVVLAVEEALFGELDALNGRSFDSTLDGIFERTNRRTGFVGPGLPAEHQDGLEGIPDGEPVPEEAPFFMGFRSGFRGSQATEDRVTIRDGPFAGGSTEHVESLELDLHVWFDQNDDAGRVARMFSPKHANTVAVGEYGEKLGTETGALDVVDELESHADVEGIVGHAQKAARARDDGEPVLLRRDVNSTDGGVAGLHFLSLQRDVEDFLRVREAMLGTEFVETEIDPDDRFDLHVGRRRNNGILEYIEVARWDHYLVPPREYRSLPSPRPDRA